mmetsp:Transcript_39035/g.72686  ORF Transcript_39035/g.72686 Transcript_39035/m.72686 type:complete len:108 (+) Transcript_39035:46-369(+)
MAGDPLDALDYPGAVPSLYRQTSTDSSDSSDSGPPMTRRDADGHLGAARAARRREAPRSFCPEPRCDEAVDSISPVSISREKAADEANDDKPFLDAEADKSYWCELM